MPMACAPRTCRIALEPLEQVQLTGRWAAPPPDVAELDLEVVYLAMWTHEFFGIMDGPVTSLRVGSGQVRRDGTFVLQIPDFSRDPVVNAYQTKGELRLHARERKTGNLPYSLEDFFTPGRSIAIPLDKPLPSDVMLVSVLR